MEPSPQLGRHVVAAVDDGGGPRIGAACLRLLVVGQGQHAEREDLVDLGRVVQIAGALGSDLRLVVEDDRRREHDVATTDEHGERAVVHATRNRGTGVLGRIEQRHEDAVVDGQHRVHRDERVTDDLVARRSVARPVGGVLDVDHDLHEVVRLRVRP